MLNRINSILCVVTAGFLFGCKTERPTPALPIVPPPTASVVRSTNVALSVSHVFSDNMVLQQNATVPIWGWCPDGQSVTVSFRGAKVSTTARDGKWMVKLRGLKAGGPDTLTISAPGITGANPNAIQLTNVLVGEVWLASGQSNMEWPLHKAFQPQADIESATNSMIRWISVPNVKANTPAPDIETNWVVCTPSNASNFSAVAFYFARSLQKELDVPIGIVQSDWGGSNIEAWMSRDTLSSNTHYKKEILDAYAGSEQAYMDALLAYYKARAEADKKGVTFNQRLPVRGWRPTELYNGMIAPLIPLSMKGAIWYQGEANVSRAYDYRALFPDLIRNWRHDWGYDFPFLFVQLAPFRAIQSHPGESEWAELREAQTHAAKAVTKTAMIVTTDVGDERELHPPKKAPVGTRLAKAALALAYGEPSEFSGPIFQSVSFREGRAFLTFDHVDGGLVSGGSALKGFSICGPDRKFVWALAQILPDNTISVWSPNVPDPVAVRYGWADYPVVNLWNQAGFPASPFRTDDFPTLTERPK